MAQVTTSLVINFRDPETAEGLFLSAEVDSREDGLNGGVTSFAPGDNVYILLYKTPSLSVTAESTSGTISQEGSGVILDIEEVLTFAGSQEATLAKYPNSTPTLSVLAGSASNLSVSGRTVRTTNKALAVVKATYQTTAYPYKLSSVPNSLGGLTDFPVVCLFTGEN